MSLIGGGSLGERLVARLSGEIGVVTRTETRHDRLRALGATPRTTWGPLADTVVLCLPGSALQGEGVERLRALGRPKRAVLISTTGFHAPYSGTIEPDGPVGTGPRAGVAARTEAAFEDWMGEQGTVVRLGGLYEKNRGPASYFARTRTARDAPGDAPLPLIHYDDAADLVVAVLQALHPPRVVLGITQVVDRRSFYETLASHLDCPPPTFQPDTGLSVQFDLRNTRDLLPRPTHPDWRTALPAVGG